VAALIVINGPPASGKSTLARMYTDAHPLALNLDLDRLRSWIGGWQDDLYSAGVLARSAAAAAAGAHLSAGHDVVVPQLLARPEFLHRLESVAADAGADFREVAILNGKADALARFAARADRAERMPGSADAAAHQLSWHQDGEEALAEMYDRLTALVATRSAARVITTTYGDPQQAYDDLLAAVSHG
jgi:predicted kinase